MAVAADSSAFVGADLAGLLTFFDLPAGTPRSQRLLPGAQRVTAQPIAMHGTSEAFVAIDGGRTVAVAPAQASQPLRTLATGLAEPVQQLSLNPSGTQLAIGTTDMVITIVDTTSGLVANRFATGLTGATIGSLRWSPDGKQLAQGNGGTVGQLGAIFDAASGQRLSPVFTDSSSPFGEFVAKGAMYATGSSNGFIQLRNPSTVRHCNRRRQRSSVSSAACCPYPMAEPSTSWAGAGCA